MHMLRGRAWGGARARGGGETKKRRRIFLQPLSTLSLLQFYISSHAHSDKDTAKSKGFAFLAYDDQRSTDLAVDNLGGATVGGRTIRVEHVDDYRLKLAEVDGGGAPPAPAPAPPHPAPPPRFGGAGPAGVPEGATLVSGREGGEGGGGGGEEPWAAGAGSLAALLRGEGGGHGAAWPPARRPAAGEAGEDASAARAARKAAKRAAREGRRAAREGGTPARRRAAGSASPQGREEEGRRQRRRSRSRSPVRRR